MSGLKKKFCYIFAFSFGLFLGMAEEKRELEFNVVLLPLLFPLIVWFVKKYSNKNTRELLGPKTIFIATLLGLISIGMGLQGLWDMLFKLREFKPMSSLSDLTLGFSILLVLSLIKK